MSKLVRVCECDYDTSLFLEAGISVEDLPFPDGKNPPNEVLVKWLNVVKRFDFEPHLPSSIPTLIGSL